MGWKKRFAVRPYKYGRDLVHLAWTEVEPMVVAVMTIRDLQGAAHKGASPKGNP